MNDPVSEIFSNPLVTGALTAIGAAIVGLWLAASWWAFSDARRRSELGIAPYLASAWVLLSTPLMLPMSLAVYALARPPQSIADRRARLLSAELADVLETTERCTVCGEAIDPAWVRCPECETWLSAPCAECGRWSAADLPCCPFCGAEERAAPAVPQRAAVTRRRPMGSVGRAAWSPAATRRPVRGPRRRAVAESGTTNRTGAGGSASAGTRA